MILLTFLNDFSIENYSQAQSAGDPSFSFFIKEGYSFQPFGSAFVMTDFPCAQAKTGHKAMGSISTVLLYGQPAETAKPSFFGSKTGAMLDCIILPPVYFRSLIE